jgi:hypothetical protein
VCLAAAAVCAILAVSAPARAQEEALGATPDIFRGAASGFVASVEADREALLPVEDLFRFIALDGSAVYETDLQTARASLLFPGNGLVLGPNLACGTFGGQAPPELAPLIDTCLTYEYPLSVTANGTAPDRATEGSLALGAPTDPVSAQAIAARAHAAPDASTSFAAMEALQVLGLPAFGPVELIPSEDVDLDGTVLTIDSATSRTDQRIVDGVLTAHAEAVLEGVRMIGGLIEIDSIRSVSLATDDAAGQRTADAALEVAGMTVAGVPAQVTDDGLVLGSPSGSSGPLQEQVEDAVNQLLEALRIRITTLEVEQTLDDGTGQAVASAGGLLVEVAADAQQLPTVPGPLGDIDPNGTYVGTILLGNTAASAGAASFEIDVPPFEAPTDVGGGAPLDLGPPAFDAGAPAADVAPTPGAQPAAGRDAPAAQELVRRLTDPFGGRMGLVYLSFMFTVLGLCVMPRFTVPARLAGARS